MTSTLKKTHRKKTSNKENTKIQKDSKRKDGSNNFAQYIQELEQCQIEQHAQDQLNYLSEIDGNLPGEQNDGQDVAGLVSGWQRNQSHKNTLKFKVTARKNFRGFSFWAKRNSIPSNYPTSSLDNYQKQQNREQNHFQSNKSSLIEPYSQLQSIAPQEQTNKKIPSLQIINIGHNCQFQFDRISAKIVQKCVSKRQNRSIDNESQFRLTTVVQNDNKPVQIDNKNSEICSEIQQLKMKILDNLNKEVVINRSGNSFNFNQVRQTCGRPKSSFNKMKKQNNTVKLSSLMEETESSANSVIMKQHIIKRRPRKLHAINVQNTKQTRLSQQIQQQNRSHRELRNHLYEKYDKVIRKIQERNYRM